MVAMYFGLYFDMYVLTLLGFNHRDIKKHMMHGDNHYATLLQQLVVLLWRYNMIYSRNNIRRLYHLFYT